MYLCHISMSKQIWELHFNLKWEEAKSQVNSQWKIRSIKSVHTTVFEYFLIKKKELVYRLSF